MPWAGAAMEAAVAAAPTAPAAVLLLSSPSPALSLKAGGWRASPETDSRAWLGFNFLGKRESEGLGRAPPGGGVKDGNGAWKGEGIGWTGTGEV